MTNDNSRKKANPTMNAPIAKTQVPTLTPALREDFLRSLGSETMSSQERASLEQEWTDEKIAMALMHGF